MCMLLQLNKIQNAVIIAPQDKNPSKLVQNKKSFLSEEYLEFKAQHHPDVFMTSTYTKQIFVTSATHHSGNVSGKYTKYPFPIPSNYLL